MAIYSHPNMKNNPIIVDFLSKVPKSRNRELYAIIERNPDRVKRMNFSAKIEENRISV
jgi:hypothetical protein